MPIRIKIHVFVAQGQPNSVKAVKNIRQLCKTKIPDQYRLKIIDVLKEPELALEKGVYLTPMLVVAAPLPHLINDMFEH